MKAAYGLGLAIALGISGALFNFFYLYRRSLEEDHLYFIGVKPDLTLTRGDTLQEQHLEKIGIPRPLVGNLADFALPYDAKQSVIGTPVWRTIVGPALLLGDDLKTPPPQELKLEPDERAWGIPIDTRQFVPSLVAPGDLVSFLVSRSRVEVPTPAAPPGPAGGELTPEPSADSASPKPTGPLQIIGPFKVLAMGNRLGSAEVMRAARIPPMQENVMIIAVKYVNNQPEDKAAKLWALLQATDFRGAGIQLHPRKTAPKTPAAREPVAVESKP